MADLSDALEFLSANHRAVLVTRRSDGSLQLSPVAAAVDQAGRIVISTRAPSAKAHNLRRDPAASLLALTDNWFGPWVAVEGEAEVIGLPEAEEGLIDQYRRVAGEHPDWDEFRQSLVDQKRVLVRITPRRATVTGR